MRTGVKLAWMVVFPVLGLVAGCGPEISKEELGRVEFRVPNLSETEKGFELPPKVIAAKERYESEHGHGHDH